MRLFIPFITVLILLCSLSLSSCRRPGPSQANIPIIALTDKGEVRHYFLPKPLYQRQMTKGLAILSKETIKTLEDFRPTSAWTIDQLSVGLGIQAELGLPATLSLSVEPTVVLIFAKMAKEQESGSDL